MKADAASRPGNGGAHAAVVALVAALLLAAAAVLATHNLGYTGMWWDEAAQFWVSQGLSGYSAPFSGPSGLRDVLRMNRLENLDPGGFSVLLHGWTTFGRGLAWLRALPFAFLVLALAAVGVLGWRLTRSAPFALAAASLPLLYSAPLYFGLEIRAYSMEMAGLALGVLALVLARESQSAAAAWRLGFTCAVFLSSRYSFALVTLALAGAYWQGCARRASRTKRARGLLALLLPVLVAGLGTWWVTLGHQLRPGMTGGALGIASPAYTRAAVLLHNSDRFDLLRRNLLAPAALPITFCALAVVFLRRRVYARLSATCGDPARLERSRGLYTMLYTFIIGLQVVSAAASAAGAYPWDITTRWSAYLVMLSAIAAVVLAAEARSLALAGLRRRQEGRPPGRPVPRLGAGLAVLVVVLASVHAMRHLQSVEGPYRTDVTRQIRLLPPVPAPHSVFVAFYEVPTVRYLFEYGPLAGRPEYPTSFRFETPAEWCAKVPFDARAEGIAFIVSALPLADARARFPGVTVGPFGPAGTRLLAVLAPAGAPSRPGG